MFDLSCGFLVNNKCISNFKFIMLSKLITRINFTSYHTLTADEKIRS